LTKPVHVHRFVGETVALSLKEPIKEFARRRHFEGILVERENDSDVVVVEFTQTDGTLFEIVVRWNEIQELRLVPRLPFGAKRSIKGNRK
jgi:ribosome maturation factor RimP